MNSLHAPGPHAPGLRHPARVLVLVATAVLLFLLAPATSARAATTGSEDTGWIRIGHLSAGTDGVDVRLTPFEGGGPIDLTDIVYGEFSDYKRVPAGLYTVAVRPAGSPMSVQPMIDQSVEVSEGGAATVVATRSGDGVVARVVQDDLTPPARGEAKVRLISGAGDGQAVSARVLDGPLLADEVVPGADTGYAAVPARTWSIELTVDGARSSLNQVSLDAGAVYTLLVVDAPGESLELQAIQDSASSAVMPVGAVDAGGGGLAGAATGSTSDAPLLLGGLGGAVLLAALTLLARRTRVGGHR